MINASPAQTSEHQTELYSFCTSSRSFHILLVLILVSYFGLATSKALGQPIRLTQNGINDVKIGARFNPLILPGLSTISLPNETLQKLPWSGCQYVILKPAGYTFKNLGIVDALILALDNNMIVQGLSLILKHPQTIISQVQDLHQNPLPFSRSALGFVNSDAKMSCLAENNLLMDITINPPTGYIYLSFHN